MATGAVSIRKRAVGASGVAEAHPLKQLAESIILQALEDLWTPARSREGFSFFKGAGFELCATMAGMSAAHRLTLLDMVAKTAAGPRAPRAMDAAVSLR